MASILSGDQGHFQTRSHIVHMEIHPPTQPLSKGYITHTAWQQALRQAPADLGNPLPV